MIGISFFWAEISFFLWYYWKYFLHLSPVSLLYLLYLWSIDFFFQSHCSFDSSCTFLDLICDPIHCLIFDTDHWYSLFCLIQFIVWGYPLYFCLTSWVLPFKFHFSLTFFQRFYLLIEFYIELFSLFHSNVKTVQFSFRHFFDFLEHIYNHSLDILIVSSSVLFFSRNTMIGW